MRRGCVTKAPRTSPARARTIISGSSGVELSVEPSLTVLVGAGVVDCPVMGDASAEGGRARPVADGPSAAGGVRGEAEHVFVIVLWIEVASRSRASAAPCIVTPLAIV